MTNGLEHFVFSMLYKAQTRQSLVEELSIIQRLISFKNLPSFLVLAQLPGKEIISIARYTRKVLAHLLTNFRY